jgi:hypothetical protein
MIVVLRNQNLAKAIRTVSSASSLANQLNGWQQHANQDTDDGNYHQQFDQGKTLSTRNQHKKTPIEKEIFSHSFYYNFKLNRIVEARYRRFSIVLKKNPPVSKRVLVVFV